MNFTEFGAGLLVKSIRDSLFGNSILSNVVMSLSLGSVKDKGVFLQARVLYVLIWVCSVSVVQANGSDSQIVKTVN